MPVFRRHAPVQNLKDVSVLVEDTEFNSRIFSVLDIPVELPQGKSSILLAGSPLLRNGIELKIELTDAEGDPVYVEPVVGWIEGAGRRASIEVYHDTPPGSARLIILGELTPAGYRELTGQELPTQWRDVYNVRWSRSILINSTALNTQPIRFYKDPKISITEKLKGFVSQSYATGPDTTVGITITEVIPQLGETGDLDPVVETTIAVDDDPNIIVSPYDDNVDVQAYTAGLSQTSTGASPMVTAFGVIEQFASEPPAKATAYFNSGNGASPVYDGGTFTISSPVLDESELSAGETLQVTPYSTTIVEVVNSNEVKLADKYITNKLSADGGIIGRYSPKILESAVSIKYNNTPTHSVSTINFTSFADVRISGMRTLSGDVASIKLYMRNASDPTDFQLVTSQFLTNPEILNDPTQPYEAFRVGYFNEQSTIDNYWTGYAGEYGTGPAGVDVDMTMTSSIMASSMFISGANYVYNETLRVESTTSIENDTNVFHNGMDYMFNGKFVGIKSKKLDIDGNTTNSAKIYIHISGSAFGKNHDLGNQWGRQLGFLELPPTTNTFNFGLTTHTFSTQMINTVPTGSGIIQFRVDSGQWHVKDVSVSSATATGFNPNYTRVMIPMPAISWEDPQKFDFLLQFYDVNENVSETIVIAANKEFSGSATVIYGSGNTISGDMYLGGSTLYEGIHFGGVKSTLQETSGPGATASGFIRSVGYLGFISASAGSGSSGFMFWSGSVLPDSGDAYDGVGLELHGGPGEGSFKFRTNPSVFEVVAKTFFVGDIDSQFISGSGGNIEISSSNFHLTPDGNVILSGTITATAGTIGGFAITLTAISSSNNSLIMRGDSGQITGSTVLFDGGKVGGWNLASTTFSGGNTILNNSGIITLGSGTPSYAQSNMIYLDGSTASGPRFSIGQFFKYSAAGILEAGGWLINSGSMSSTAGIGLTIDSTNAEIVSGDYVSNERGWIITSQLNGFAEFENARIRGTLKTTVFEKEEVNAVGGQLWVANSTTISESISNSDTSFPVDNVTGFVDTEIIFAKKITSTGFSTEYMTITGSSRNDASSDTDFSGFLHATRATDASVPGGSEITASLLAFSASTAASYEAGQVLVSTGRVNTGYIRLNANPSDDSTPYIDFVERTGTGIYDLDITCRIGDLSGLSPTRTYGNSNPGFGMYAQNIFLTGGITANTGSIGGIKMQSNKLYIGTGTYGNTNTSFYVDDAGQMSLKDKFTWDGSTLAISGQITIEAGGNAATTTYADTQANTAESNAESTAAVYSTNTELSASNALAPVSASVFTDSSGRVVNPPSTGTAGLFLGSQFLGYHNGSDWKTYMDNTGNFYLDGDGTNSLSWDGTSLVVHGVISASSGYFSGNITSEATMSGGYMVGSTYKTAETGNRIIINDGNTNNLLFMSGSGAGTEVVRIDDDIVENTPGIRVQNPYGVVYIMPSDIRSQVNATATALTTPITGLNSSLLASTTTAINGTGFTGDDAAGGSIWRQGVWGEALIINTSTTSGIGVRGTAKVAGTGNAYACHFSASADSGLSYAGYFDGNVYISQKLGIGNARPPEPLSVTGNISGSGVIMVATGSQSSPAFSFSSDTDTGFWRSATGQISVSNNNSEEFRFEADGDFHADGDVIGNSTSISSDKRLKANIIYINGSLNLINQLKPATFNWKYKKSDNRMHYGLIAQDVEKVLPDLVDTIKQLNTKDKHPYNEHKTIRYNELIPLLINSINELTTRVNELEEKIGE